MNITGLKNLYNILNIFKSFHSKIWSYTCVDLKVWTKRNDPKILED